MRVIFLLLLWASLQVLSGQSLPFYLTDTFPAANAAGVPTNVNIILSSTVGLEPPPFVSTGVYTLKAGSAAAVSFANTFNCNCFGTVITPAAPLSPNTSYTFTVNPGGSVGPAYSFSFTTGAGPDNTPPHLVGIDPPPGTTGLGLIGPFQIHFDKRIVRSTQNQGVLVRALPKYVYAYPISTAVSADGTTVIATISLQQGYPVGFEITVDPTQFADAYGNAGQGKPLVADYTTFIATDASGPHLQSSLPADGDSGVATNVMPRLIFQKLVDTTTLVSGIQLLSDGVSQSITLSPNDAGNPNTGGAITIQPAKVLAPNQTYTIVIGTDLQDTNGFRQGQSQSIQFTTGPGPDLVVPAVLGTSPSGAPFPANGQILIKTNKPISPIVLSRLSAVGIEYGQFRNQPWPAFATLSPDGTLLTLSPATPFKPEYYGVLTSEIIDTSGATFFGLGAQSFSFNVSDSADNNAPTLLAVNPPPNSTSVPPGGNIQVVFSEPCATCLFPNALTVSANGRVLPLQPSADYGSNNASFTFTPGALSPSTTYTVSLRGIQDLAGNAMADTSFSFTTGATSSYPPVKLLSSSVNNGDTGVNPSGPFTFRYDSTLNPAAAVTAASLQGPGTFVYPALSIASGSTLTVTPVNPLPANTAFQLVVTGTSLSGGAVQTQIAFTTAPGSDTTRPQVTRISPVGGSTVRYGSAPVVLTFSKPLNPSTVTGSSISLYIDGQLSSAMPVRSADNLSVSVPVPNLQADSFTVVVSSAIQDLAGNALVPFEATYPLQSGTPGTNAIHEMRPAFGSNNVPADTAVTWFLDQPVDLAAISASLVTLVNFSPVPGTFDLAGGGRILRFVPANPFPAGSAVSFYERTPILGMNDNSGYSRFTIAPLPAKSLQYVRSTVGLSSAIDSVFEVEFNQEPPLGHNVAGLTFGTGNGSTINVAFTESIPRPRVLRLTTTAPRQPGYYTIILSNAVTGDINSPRYLTSTLSAVPFSGSPTVANAGPAASGTGVPVNVSARILFGAAINPLSVTTQSAVLSISGAAVSTQIAYPSNNREIILRPLQAIPPNAAVKVLLTGLQDLAGHAIPDYSWNFTSGSGDPDFVRPSILYTSLPAASNGGVQIAANEAVQIVFSKPIDPGISVGIGYTTSRDSSNAASITLSPDLLVLTVAPVTTWAAGQQYSVNINNEFDLEGNAGAGAADGSDYSTYFTVAFSPSATPPRSLGVSPPDGSSGMPLNARIMAAFDRPITVSPGGISLTDSNGNVMKLERLYYNDASLAVFAPLRPLLPDTTYNLSLANATDLSGHPLTSPVSTTFTTGEAADLTGPIGTYAFVSPLPTNMPIWLRFNEPLSPATVTPGRIQLFLGNVPEPVTAALSMDGASITVTPQQPLIPGDTYSLRIGSPTDFAGNPAIFGTQFGGNSAGTTFVAGSSAITAPPVISIFPPNGSTGVPANIQSSFSPSGAPVRVSFSTAADLLSSTPMLQVLQNGVPVAGSVSIVSTGITFVPSSAYQYSTTYQVQVSGVVDYLGNAAVPVSSTFTTSGSLAADHATFSITSIQPADGSVGIDNNTPIVVTFSKMLEPSFTFFTVRSSLGFPLYVQTTVSGSTLTFTPAEPWPSGGTVSTQFSPQYLGNYALPFHDLSGIVLDKNYSFSFSAAVIPDATPLTLVSITPSAGTPLSPANNTFTLVFSKAVVVGPNALQAFNGSQSTSITPYYAPASSHIISTSTFATPDTVLTIVGTSGIQDANGNSITPFTVTYPTLHADQSGPPSVTSISPNSYATGVQTNTPIKIAFNKPMDPASLVGSVMVTQNGVLIAGQLQVLDSNQSVQFTPSAQYPPGARIDVFVLTTATDLSGAPPYQQYQSFFTVAGTNGQPAAAPSMSVSLAGFSEAIDPHAGLDLAFDHEVDPASASDQNVWLRVGHTRIPGAVFLRDSRTLRFQPAEPLTVGAPYVLTAGPGLRSIEGLFNQPSEFRVRPELADPVRIESVEYQRGPAPLAIRVRFSGPISPISAGALRVLATDGSEVRTSILPSTNGREWLLLLDSAVSVRVIFEGVHDQWGRALPRESREPVVVQ